MPTIVVEDGSTVSGANSYVTTAELETFASNRGKTLVADPGELLILAMDFLEQQNFKGCKKASDQSLQWPRTDVCIDSYYFDIDKIPTELKNAQMQIALAIDEGNSPDAVIDRKVKREKVDTLEVEYADGSASRSIDPKINRFLKKLVRGGVGALEVVKHQARGWPWG